MVTSAAKREAAAHLCSVHGVSQRRACLAIGVERISIRYRGRRPDDGAVALEWRAPSEDSVGLLCRISTTRRVF